MTFGELFQNSKMQAADAPVGSLCKDSRQANASSVFFCLVGEKFDGHTFAADAYRRGCRCFVAEHPLPIPKDAEVVLCDDARGKLADLSARFFGYPASRMLVVGITGTKGKTTTALMLRGLLAAVGIPAAYIGSSGVFIGDAHYETENTTPESVDLQYYLSLVAEAGIRIAILEVSSQALACGRVRGIRFPISVFTNLTQDHIGTGEHRTMTEYRSAKLRLFSEFSSDKVILNGEDPFSRVIFSHCGSCKCIFYGNCQNTSVFAEEIQEDLQDNRFYTRFRVFGYGETHALRLPFAGRHYVSDLLAALTVACELTGKRPGAFAGAVGKLWVDGRCEIFSVPHSGTFVIDYAHNWASLRAALCGLRPYVRGKLYCLFGAIGERSQCRRYDMAAVAARYADFSVITEDNPGDEDPEEIAREILKSFGDSASVLTICDRAAAIRYLISAAKEGDVVLLAGKGNEKYQLRGTVRYPFSEAEILKENGAKKET